MLQIYAYLRQASGYDDLWCRGSELVKLHEFLRGARRQVEEGEFCR